MPVFAYSIPLVSLLWILFAFRSSLKTIKFKNYFLLLPFAASFVLIFFPKTLWVQLAWLFALFMGCGLWPFQRILLNSLNAPTPLLALIQGVLIPAQLISLKQALPFFETTPYLLFLLQILGLLSLILGILWRLVSANIKTALCCTTIAFSGLILFLFALGSIFSLIVAALMSVVTTFFWLRSASAIQTKANPSFVLKTKWGARLYVALLNQSTPSKITSLRRNTSL